MKVDWGELTEAAIKAIQKELAAQWDNIPAHQKKKALELAGRIPRIAVRKLAGEDTRESEKLLAFALGVIAQITTRRANEAVTNALFTVVKMAAKFVG